MTGGGGASGDWFQAPTEPTGWWGPVWQRPEQLSIVDLLRGGVIDAEAGAVLWALLARRSSLVVAAGPSGAGKTTLLTALLDFLPGTTTRVYTRGRYETFDWLAGSDPATTALLVNEISPHLPIYTWDDGVRRLTEAADRGFQVLATAHARSVEDLAFSLAGYPTRIAAWELAAFDTLLVLDAWRSGEGVARRVRGVVGLRVSGDGRGLDATEMVAEGRLGKAGLDCIVRASPDGAAETEVEREIEARRLWLACVAEEKAWWTRAELRQAIARWSP